MDQGKKHCSEKVFGTGTWGSFHPYACSKPYFVTRTVKSYNGSSQEEKDFCKIHDPERVKAKNEEHQKEYDAKWSRESLKNNIEQKRKEICEYLQTPEGFDNATLFVRVKINELKEMEKEYRGY